MTTSLRGSDPASRLAAADAGEHVVCFYDSEAFFTESVVEFVMPALAADDPVVAVLTAPHGQRLRAALREVGVAIDELGTRGRLRIVDAEETLAQLLVDGMPDPRRFRALVGGLFDAERPDRVVRACGEMVTVLWNAGNVPGMLALEELWNELLATRPVALLCPYPMQAFGRERSDATFHRVCDAHSVVLPSELYSELPDADQRSRAVAVLQHEAVIGINERIALREALHQHEAELRRLRALDRLRSRLVDGLTHGSGQDRADGDRDGGFHALQKTAVRQVRAALGAVSCSYHPEGSNLDGDGAPLVVVPVSTGPVRHGVLTVELPAGRHLDEHDVDFLAAVAQTLAAAAA